MKLELNPFVLVDPKKCINCRSCEVACAASHRENGCGSTVGNMDTPIVPRAFIVKNKEYSIRIQCRQCEDSPCAQVCPTEAITYEDENIIVNQKLCIGCKTCTIVCPIGAVDLMPKFEGKSIDGGINRKLKLIAYKCDLCKNAGGEPNCVKACPEDALRIVNPEEDKKDHNIKAALELMSDNGL
ncbi:4Fe-4S dicluster domain-containing protein [Clostridium fermenticellae]|uniref:4Fe-4S dicluster domain-containing protein n=1 Tax=Clostridium fermenticellae TaxID=2068654 RepID=A0A386H2E5_9CLOT|nr:4Fe-4S dicluster domain-containing protein [Clostridium fermenticellae]AYD39872.1 4Fe-4S dicluster domain-containing protein [Clostridium fermenticellae]